MVTRLRPILLSLLLILFSTILPVPSSAQTPISLDSPVEGYLQALVLAGRVEQPYLNYRTQGSTRWYLPTGGFHPWAGVVSFEQETRPARLGGTLHPATWEMSYNSSYPDGGNDGSAWQGRGFNTWVQAGGEVTYGGFRAALAPTLWFAENRAFDLIPSASSFDNEYAYYTNNIDLPQQFGPDPVVKIDAGESELRYTSDVFTAALSNQSIWLGPAQHNPVLLSNNAGGFPRLEVGLPMRETAVGAIEAYAWWGLLTQSEYFDVAGVPEDRLFSGISVSYSPTLIPGFTVGVHRVVLTGVDNLDGRTLIEPFNPFMTPELGQDLTDQRASITLDWNFPEVGFNVYAEWGKNDYSARWSHIVRAPEHSQAFTYGIRQLLYANDRHLWLVNGEISQFVHSRDYDIDLGKSTSGFYTHHKVRQGHTHNGQLLGPQAGPGSDAQTLTLDYYSEFGRLGGFIERVNRNKDFIYGDPSSGPGDIDRMNVQMRYGVSGEVWLPGSVLLSSEVSIGRNWNRNYELRADRVYNAYTYVGLTYGY